MSGAGPLTNRCAVLLLGFVLACLGGLSVGTQAASADETVWLCRPGIPDNPCLDESLGGRMNTPGSTPGMGSPLGFRPARNPRFDCFYVYPTQSIQDTPNADLSRDEELKEVAVNQANQFSRLCRVFSPVYRQYTFSEGNPTEEQRDIAYAGVRQGFYDYLEDYSRGRGFVLLGHSQGASHLARLIDEEIDGNRALRDRMISAIVPGSNNVYVPKDGVVGGNLQRIPACESGDQLRCVMAWSVYRNRSESGLPAQANFGRLSTGYWVYPEPRPDPALFEVLCVNPAELSGDQGDLSVLANLLAFSGFLGEADPWEAFEGFYRAECLTGEDASWLDLTQVPGTNPFLGGILDQINSTNGGLHTADVNLVLGNLIEIVARQGARHTRWREASARAERLAERLVGARRALERSRSTGAPAARRAALVRKVRSLKRQLVVARAERAEAYGASGGSSTG